MSLFKPARFVALAVMLLPLGGSIAQAGDDQAPSDDQAVTAETRKQIVQTLLDLVRDEDGKVEVRASAARSLGMRASEIDVDKAEVREALMTIVKAENSDPKVKFAAITALRQSKVELTDAHRATIGAALWEIVVKAQGSDERARRVGAAVWAFNQYHSKGKSLPAPEDVAAVQALLAFSRGSSFPHRGRRYSKEQFADGALGILTETAGGVRILIKTLDSLEMEPPEEISIALANQFGRNSRTNDLHEIREQVARHLFEENREKLMALLGDTLPRNEKIAQLLLKAAQHENPDIRAAAIEALGNEIPGGNAIPERDSGAAAAPAASS